VKVLEFFLGTMRTLSFIFAFLTTVLLSALL